MPLMITRWLPLLRSRYITDGASGHDCRCFSYALMPAAAAADDTSWLDAAAASRRSFRRFAITL